jgi:hypothetical protein
MKLITLEANARAVLLVTFLSPEKENSGGAMEIETPLNPHWA